MSLMTRPRYKGMPIPWVQSYKADGVTPDFTAVDPAKVLEAAKRRLCGLCGQKMGWWVAFIGGPQSTAMGTYSDPAMHPECAHQALTLCPHIALQGTQRARKLRPGLAETPGFVTEKPKNWCVLITRSYEVKGEGDHWYIKAGRPKKVELYGYDDDGKLVSL